MAKTNQRVALTKKLLQQGMVKLIDKEDVAKITVLELCQQAGINRSTFYKHYGCPHEVVVELEEEIIKGLGKAFREKFADSSPSITATVECFCSYLFDHRTTVKALFNNPFTNQEFLQKLNQQFNNQLIVKQKLLQGTGTTEKMLLSTYFNYGFYYLVREWLLNDLPMTPHEIGGLICQIKTVTKGW